MKKTSTILLSLLIFHAGVAWALEVCLRHDRHSEHTSAEPHAVFDARVTHQDSHEPTVPSIHCVSENQRVGPAARIASTTISRPDKTSPLQIASLSDLVSVALRNDLWLNAVFRSSITILLPIDLARHLFLSVLRI